MNRAIYALSCGDRHYVGGSHNVARRLREHRASLRSGRHINRKLQSAWAEKGEEAFELHVLEYVSPDADIVAREQYWIDRLRAVECGFNLAVMAGGSLGMSHTPEARAKISAAGRNRPVSDALRAKRAAYMVGNKLRLGRRTSAETRSRISSALAACIERRGKLTWAQVREVRRRVAAGESQRSVALSVGVTQSNVSRIVAGQTWREPA